MVRLDMKTFAATFLNMCDKSGVKKTKIALRVRCRHTKVVLRCTDDVSTFTSTVHTQQELKTAESLLLEYMARATVKAPADAADPSGGKGGKKKGNKK